MVSKVSFDDVSSLFFHISSRCDALPTDLDGPASHQRTHEKTDYFIRSFQPGKLWDDVGIRHDISVCLYPSAFDVC